MTSTLRRTAWLFALLALLWAGGAAAPVQAQQGGLTIAVIDVQLVLRKAKAAQSIREAAEAQRKRFEAQIEAAGKQIRADEEKLRQQQTILAPEVASKRRRELEQRFGQLQRQADQIGKALNGGVNNSMLELRREMLTVLAEVMKERNINATLARSAVLIFDQNLDISEDVIARLDAKVTNIEVKVDPAGGSASQ